MICDHARIQKILSDGVQPQQRFFFFFFFFFYIFLVDEGREDPITTTYNRFAGIRTSIA